MRATEEIFVVSPLLLGGWRWVRYHRIAIRLLGHELRDRSEGNASPQRNLPYWQVWQENSINTVIFPSASRLWTILATRRLRITMEPWLAGNHD